MTLIETKYGKFKFKGALKINGGLGGKQIGGGLCLREHKLNHGSASLPERTKESDS